MNTGRIAWVIPISFWAFSGPAAGTESTSEATSTLKKLSLEELLDIEVTSVSRKEERASQAAAAVHVITEEDIRRSGARSLPEALRLAPNLQVAQASSRAWAISARGFNASFSNKLLVLIDGRTVYSPLFAGVFWDAQDTLLEDIARIEVISGPGAALWGANAVNGIINIITKSAEDTHGFLLSAGSGNEERLFGGARFGGDAGDNLHYRYYAKYFDRDDAVLANGADASDAWNWGQGGFRLDWARDEQNLLTLQGDLYDGSGEQVVGADISQSGGNVLARWTRSFSDSEQLQVQVYYDRARQFVPGDFGDALDAFDLDTQYERDLGERQHLLIGAGYRFTSDDVTNLPGGVAFLPASLDLHLVSAFVQDDIALRDRVKLTLGSKVEHNDYTGLEVQPNVRIAWTGVRHVVWSAISRAVRTPSRFDRHLFFPASPPFIFAGGPDFDSEKAIAYELGWRVTPHEDIVASIAAFFTDYDDIRSTSLGPPFVTENNVEGEIYGAELQANWQVLDRWRLASGYVLLQEDIRVRPGRVDLNSGQGETFDPQHQLQVRSSVDLPRSVEVDVWVRYVDEIGSTGRGFGVVPDYWTLDTRIGWSPLAHLEIAIVGQNLLDERHPEFGFREIERAVYGMLSTTW